MRRSPKHGRGPAARSSAGSLPLVSTHQRSRCRFSSGLCDWQDSCYAYACDCTSLHGSRRLAPSWCAPDPMVSLLSCCVMPSFPCAGIRAWSWQQHTSPSVKPSRVCSMLVLCTHWMSPGCSTILKCNSGSSAMACTVLPTAGKRWYQCRRSSMGEMQLATQPTDLDAVARTCVGKQSRLNKVFT